MKSLLKVMGKFYFKTWKLIKNKTIIRNESYKKSMHIHINKHKEHRDKTLKFQQYLFFTFSSESTNSKSVFKNDLVPE